MEPFAAFMLFLLERHAIGQQGETISAPMTWFCISSLSGNAAELDMNGPTTNDSEQIDRKTNQSIRDGVGERLRQDLRPVESVLPSHLEHLMDELHRQDDSGRRVSST
jgi:hypothetical protein